MQFDLAAVFPVGFAYCESLSEILSRCIINIIDLLFDSNLFL